MTPERWQQVKELFQAVRECPGSQRAAVLAAACASDEDLQREVESLLAAYDEPGNFMAQPALAPPWNQAEPEELISGQTLGPYFVEHKLGQGGMGVVYQARDTRLGRPLALKLLHQYYTQDADRVRRFQQEARAASALNHPNILTIYEGGQVETTHFIATEFVEGQTLRALLTNQQLSLSTALDIVIQVLGALVAAHQAGIIHRDIKPENIMVRPDGIVKVLDFGLAKLFQRRGVGEWESGGKEEPPLPLSLPLSHSPTPPLSTSPGFVMGTVAYMSPEQARGLAVDARSDLFSVGVVLYELLTGHKPFDGETPSDILAALLEREPAPLVQHRSNLPPELQHLINHALAKSVAERYPSAQAMLDELKDLKQALDFSTKLKHVSPDAETVAMLDVGAPSSSDQQPLNENKRSASMAARSENWGNYLLRRRTGWMIAGLAVVVVMGLAVMQWKKQAGRPTDSIAVLPFLNVGNDPQLEYIPDGLTEDLIDRLMRLSSLRIKARSTVFNYKGRMVDPRQVGKDLQVLAVVLGRVQRQGDVLLIRVELVDAVDGAQLWSSEYRTSLQGLLSVQDEIAHEMTAKLRLRLSSQEQSKLAKAPTTDPEAYRLYMEGRHHWNKRSGEGMQKGLALFQQAAAQDRKFALAYVGIADAYATFGTYHLMPPKEALPRAREAAEQALKIDDNLAEAHASLGKIFTDYYWEWERAEQEFQRAIALQPNYENTHLWYSSLLIDLGRFAEADREARRALERDPLSPVLSTQLGNVLYRARRYDEGIAVLQKTLDIAPRHVTARVYLGVCYAMQKKYEPALAEFRKGLEQVPNSPDFLALIGATYALMGQREQAHQTLAQLDELAKHTYVSPFCYTAIYVQLGEWGPFFKWMEVCYEQRDPTIRGLKTDPSYDQIRTDPRLVSLLQRAGFTS